MLTFNASLKTLLDSATTKLDWANKLQTALGNTRTLRCFRDSNSSATDPAASGTEFLRIGSSGALTIVAGNITGFGTLSGTTIKLAADLSSGKSVLRIEGNGNYVQGTLGLTGSSADFVFSANPTGSNGIAFAPGAGTKAPIFLDSGTGPLSPTLTDAAPYSVEIQDWTTGSAVKVGEVIIDTRMRNMVFDDSEVASNMGDVRVYRSSTSLAWGDHEFGVVMFAMTGQSNSVSSDPVYQVLVGFKPNTTNWPNYPSFAGYIFGTSDTFCKAGKAVIKNRLGQPLYTHEMRDGLPFNSSQLNQSSQNINDKAVRPMLNCGQMMPWQSVRPKMSSFAKKWYPGAVEDAFRPTACRRRVSTNMAAPMLGGRYNNDSLGNWFLAPKWAMSGKEAQANQQPNYDQYSYDMYTDGFDWFGVNGAPGNGRIKAAGWGWELGTFGIMDHYTGPGGSRHDRAAMPTPYAIHLSKSDYVRPRGNDSIVDMIDAWNFQYFNLPIHYIKDVATFETISLDDAAKGIWGQGRPYYDGLDSYVPGGKAVSVPVFTWPRDQDSGFRDRNGRLPWNGASIDALHNYSTPLYAALFYNSPMHVYSGLHRLITSFMCQLGGDGSEDVKEFFMRRHHAWRLLQLTLAWKVSGDHEFMPKRQIVEDRFQRELEAVYKYAYKPAMLDNSNYTFHAGLRNLGLALKFEGGIWREAATTQASYMGQVLQLMKQFGLWKVMMNKSDQCKKSLLFIIRCLDKQNVDFILDTRGDESIYTLKANISDENYAVPYDSWAEFGAANPASGQQSWIRNADGSYRDNIDQDITQHLRYQWVRMRLDYFPEIPCERVNGLTDADAKYKALYADITANVASTPSKDSDWGFRWPGLAVIKTPTILGDAA